MSGPHPFEEWPVPRAPRRLQALLYIAEHPGASNREVGASVGVGDDGQVSRILRRLLDLGLAVNRNGGDAPGGPNAWYLTVAGMHAVADAVSAGANAEN